MTILVAAFLAAVTAAAQSQPVQVPAPRSQQPAPRDTSSTAKKGTAVLKGLVANTEGHPLRRAQIRISGETVPDGRTASTNSLGKWEVRDLPAGRFSVSVSRAGYLSAQYGQKRPGEPGQMIDVDEGAIFDHLDFVLTHNAVITGHVYDEAGEPLAGATVLTMQMRFFNGRRHLVPTRNGVTDDSGQYRLGGLEAGDYYVYASSRETWESDPPEVKVLGFLPTMYPAATSIEEAQRVRVRAGQEVNGIEIPMVPGKAGTISGTAFNAQGLPLAGETVNLGVEIRGETFSSFYGTSGTKVNPDGTFAFRNVSPGEYHLTVHVIGTERPVESANVVVNLGTNDVQDVNLVTSAAGVVSGRVIVDPGATLPIPLSRLTVRALPVDRETATNLGAAADNGRVRDDGSFELKSLIGNNRLTIAPLPDGWAVREIDQNGRDLASQPFDTRGQTLTDAAIILTNRFGTLTAALQDAQGAPTLDGVMVLFPEDSALWSEDIRMIRTARPAQNGAISMRAVRPGTYLAAAVPSLTTSEANDPEFLESLRAQATRVAVIEAGSPQVTLVVKPAPRQ